MARAPSGSLTGAIFTFHRQMGDWQHNGRPVHPDLIKALHYGYEYGLKFRYTVILIVSFNLFLHL
jgi:hypothetical protein